MTVLVAALLTPAAYATHLVVRADGSGDVPTFQAGVDCVLGRVCDPPPDTLLVEAGLYLEDVSFDMSASATAAVIMCPAGPAMTRLRKVASGGGFSARATVVGLGIDSAVVCSETGSMIHWRGCQFLGDAFSHGFIGSQEFSDCEFRGKLNVAGAGSLDRCSFVGARAALQLTIFGLSIRDCRFENCADTAVVATPGDESFIAFERCVFRAVDRAIVVNPDPNYHRDGVQVKDCLFEDVRYEAISYDSHSNWSLNWLQFVVQGSRFSRCGSGIRVQGPGRIDLTMSADTLEDTQGLAIDAAARLNWNLDGLLVRRGAAGAVALHEQGEQAPEFRFMTRSVIEDNAGDALVVQAGSESTYVHRFIAQNVITRNGGVGIRTGDGTTVVENLVVGNGGHGLHLTPSRATADSATRNTLVGNGGTGLLVAGPTSGPAPTVFVQNNLSAKNLGVGLALQGMTAGMVTGNDAWRNHVGDYQGPSLASNLIQNPLLCDPALDFHVAQNSPCAASGPYGQIGAFGAGCGPQVVGVDPAPAVALAIARVAPNPLIGGREVTVSFTLPAPGFATMEVLDAGGRRMVTRPLNASGAGSQRVQLRMGELPPGIYWLRVAQAGRAASSKVCILP